MRLRDRRPNAERTAQCDDAAAARCTRSGDHGHGSRSRVVRAEGDADAIARGVADDRPAVDRPCVGSAADRGNSYGRRAELARGERYLNGDRGRALRDETDGENERSNGYA